MVGAKNAHGNATSDGALELLAIAHTAAVILNQHPQRDAQFKFVGVRLVDVTTHAHELGAVTGHAARQRAFHTHLLPPLHAVLHDGHYCGKRFNIVDDGWASKQTLDGWERRLHTRPAALAFNRFKKRGFFTADVCAGRAMQHHVHCKL